MKRNTILIAILLLLNIKIINSVELDISASLKIGKIISITEDTEINFGKIIIDKTTESVVNLLGDGTITVSSGNATTQGNHTIGTFTLTGDPNQEISSVSVSSTGSLINGAHTINTTYAIHNTAPTALDATGKATFNVVGSVTIPVNSVSGEYKGTYSVIYTY